MADYSAYAVIGIEIDLDKIPKIKIKKKTFDHNFSETTKFSPDDGRKLWEENEIPEYTFDDEDERDIKIIKVEGCKLWKGTDGEPQIFGFGVGDTYSNGGNDYDFHCLKSIDSIRENLQKKLEPLGLWDNKRFGLYSILQCSY